MSVSSPTTIFALSTAPGRAAIAVIRISGPAAGRALAALIARPEPTPHREARLATLRNPETGEPLDQALVLFFAAPATETGEDVAELQIHGGRAVVNAVLEALALVPGCRPAEAGEFAHRAFVNGKMDLTAAEGLADLIDAETEAQRAQALTLATGSHARLYDGWRTRLIEAQALTESAIDFSDEADVSDTAIAAARQRIQVLHREFAAHLAGAHRGEIIRHGYRVVIAGPPNAGKSTLLNALARRDAAIVSDEAGTTRDAIEVHLDLGGIAVIVTDTAGIRETVGNIEREGIRRTYSHAGRANLILWLIDPANPAAPPCDFGGDCEKLLIATKKDRLSDISGPQIASDLSISAACGDGLDELSEIIIGYAAKSLDTGSDLAPTSARQTYHLKAAQRSLENYLGASLSDIELRAEDLRLAADSLGRLTGRIDAEDILDQVFSRFCIGK